MGQEETFDWLLGGLFWILAVCMAIVSLVLIASYTTEVVLPKEAKDPKCINSACEPCKPTGRFVRHAGCKQ